MSPLDTSHSSAPTTPRTPQAAFETRHIGLNQADMAHMLATSNAASLDSLIKEVIPTSIRRADSMQIEPALSEAEALAVLG